MKKFLMEASDYVYGILYPKNSKGFAILASNLSPLGFSTFTRSPLTKLSKIVMVTVCLVVPLE